MKKVKKYKNNRNFISINNNITHLLFLLFIIILSLYLLI